MYFTNGGPPLLSELIEPIWTGDVEVYFQSDTLNHAQIALSRMAWHDERCIWRSRLVPLQRMTGYLFTIWAGGGGVCGG